MKVSVVTLSFNQAPYLERAIRSVIEQDHDDIEYIVVDPGSTDGSREIIERYRDRIATVITEPDKGPPDGLNNGFAAATGDVYAYMNADDAFLPGAIGEAVAAFGKYPDADVIVGHGYIVDGHGRPVRHFRSAPFTPWRFAHGAAVVMQQSTFFRASAFKATDGFNIDNRTSWDAELLLDMGLAGAKVKVVEGDWSIFAIYADSISGSQRMGDESLVNHRRYFERVMGRPQRPSDDLMFKWARAWRWITDPCGLYARLRARSTPLPEFPDLRIP
ncbi:MAG: glycosyltransferase [Alphaproteobacteria bacterium]|nr:glycosyltransferase [Alphaproteobacteria bacterium]